MKDLGEKNNQEVIIDFKGHVDVVHMRLLKTSMKRIAMESEIWERI